MEQVVNINMPDHGFSIIVADADGKELRMVNLASPATFIPDVGDYFVLHDKTVIRITERIVALDGGERVRTIVFKAELISSGSGGYLELVED